MAFEAPAIEVARLIASLTGWTVDVEPGEPGKVRITATRGTDTRSTNGSTVEDAATKLIGTMTHE